LATKKGIILKRSTGAVSLAPVLNKHQMFFLGAAAFNQPLSSWNISSVEAMTYAFHLIVAVVIQSKPVHIVISHIAKRMHFKSFYCRETVSPNSSTPPSSSTVEPQ
jgi:Mycoplasma protein of unknown function, DUF285